jgi:hypothetical protein
MSWLEIKTWQNSLNFEQMADKVIPWIASSKSSDQKSDSLCRQEV